MSQPGRPKAALVLRSFDERHQLRSWAFQPPEDAPWLALRCQIVLACAEDRTNREVAALLGVSERTVSKWRGRYLAFGLAGLRDAPRPGVPRSISDEQVAALLAATLGELAPDGRAWTTRSMEKAIGLSASSVGRFWREYGLNPHRIDIFDLSADPAFVGKVRDVVGLYLNPPEGALVLCVDENAPSQTSNRPTPLRPRRPRPAERRGDDDWPSGPTDLADLAGLQAALAVAGTLIVADPAITQETERTRDRDLRTFLGLIDKSVPADLDVHVVLDHSATTMTEPIRQWRLRHLRFQFHFAPTYGWWVYLVERWLAEFTHQGSPSRVLLEGAINAWMATWGEDPRHFVWHKSTAQILAALAADKTMGEGD